MTERGFSFVKDRMGGDFGRETNSVVVFTIVDCSVRVVMVIDCRKIGGGYMYLVGGCNCNVLSFVFVGCSFCSLYYSFK